MLVLFLVGYAVGIVIGTDVTKTKIKIFTSCEKYGAYVNEHIKMKCEIEK